MFSKIKDAVVRFVKREPVVVVNTSGAFLYGLVQEIGGEVTTADGWKALGLAAVTVLARRYVTPAVQS